MNCEELAAADLCLKVDPVSLGFVDTSSLVGLPLPWIGQTRAEAAARFGMQISQRDYNLFVLGNVGSGRRTLLSQMMREQAACRAVPPDLCYLNNFDEADHPLALRVPAGQGRVLRLKMGQWIKDLQTELPKRLQQDDFLAERQRIEQAGKIELDAAYATLSAYAEAHHFALMRDQGHMVFTIKDAQGEPVTAGQALLLSREKRAEMDAAEEALRSEIGRYLDKTRALERVMAESLTALRRQTLKPMLDQGLARVHHQMNLPLEAADKLASYAKQAQQCVLDNLALFEPGDEEAVRQEALQTWLTLFRVNVAVDNHACTGAPVIVEDNPLYRNLFGSIEYESDGNDLVTDFDQIRAGSLLRAHGGFLMLHLRDLLTDPPVWEKLGRFLRSGRLQIEEPGMAHQPMAAVSLTPEAVDVDVKLVLIASVEAYYEVQEMDPEFARRFRCKVDFAESFKATAQTVQASAVFVAHTCERLGLRHFSAAAVALIVEDSHRLAGDQTRQSALFGQSETLVIESHAIAQGRGSARVEAVDVQAAQAARLARLACPQERIQETIADGERLLVVSGELVAQINGLTVMDLGDHAFGVPVRVTARSFAGDEGLLNIEREVEMSGPIHDKGVLILHSYLAALFAHIAPLSMNAAVVFEQEYGGVEGDSASCAELFALLSSLSGLPLRQGIAVTGAVNQHGELLPVGGINEKIEGYFRSCELLGLDGQQGVLMPSRNRRHLMLNDHVVQAVSQGRFHIHMADEVGEGMTLLTGRPFGQLIAGGYPPQTVLGCAEKNLLNFRRACEAMALRRAAPHGRKKGH